jgi:hypothetical protein
LIPQVIGPPADRSLPPAPQASEAGAAVRPEDPFGNALNYIGALETAVIARLKSYESDLFLLKANAEKAVEESTKLSRRLLEVTVTLNDKATTVSSAHQKLDAILAGLIKEQSKAPKSAASPEVPKALPRPSTQDQEDLDRMQAEINSQARKIEILEEQLKTDRMTAKRTIDELDAELQRERLQHALAGDRSFGRAA